jgi:hypothetical protein
MQSGEQRKHVRVKFELPVRVQLPDGTERPAQAGDLSLGGMSIGCEGPAPPFGAAVKLVLQTPPTELVLSATVRWSAKEGFGVQFGLMGARETRALLALIKQAKAAT